MSWSARLRYWVSCSPRINGKRRCTYHDTREDAERWLAEQLAPKTQPTASAVTLGNHLLAWFDRGKPVWTERTQRGFWHALKRCGPIGDVRLADVRPSHVEQLCNSLLAAGRSPATIRITRAVLRAALGDAERERLIPHIPMPRLRLPKRAPKESPAYSLTQAKAILEAAAQHPYGIAVELGLVCGMRIGEITALEWRDLDAEAGTLTIRRTAGLRTNEPGDATKTGQSRVIPLPGRCLEALRRRKLAESIELSNESKRASPVKLSRYVLPGRDPRRHISPSAARDRMTEVLRAAKVPVRRPHALRHSSASLLAALGVPSSTVMLILGHTRMEQTASYTHSDLQQMGEAMKQLERALG